MRKSAITLLAVLLFIAGARDANSTFSICAVDLTTGEVGSAGASCIANCLILSYVLPNWGVAHIQASWTQTNYNNAKRMMLLHYPPQMIIDSLILQDGNPAVRQYGIVDMQAGGRVAAYTGVNCTNYKGHKMGIVYSIQGNILLGSKVLDSMEARFLRQPGTLADKLMAALQGAKMPGADTRCSGYNKSAISSFVRVGKPADTAGSNLYLNLVVGNTPTNKDPIDSLQTLYNQWLLTNTIKTEEGMAADAELHQNYPNPFNQMTRIGFSIPRDSKVVIKVYDISGKMVAVLIDENMRQGNYNTPFSINSLSSGVYLYSMETEEMGTGKRTRITKQMVLLK